MSHHEGYFDAAAHSVVVLRCRLGTAAADECSKRECPAPGNWAQPRQVSGLPNLHKVSDDLYRGAQPTAEGFKQLGSLGVKTVVNLRSFHTDEGKIDQHFRYEHIAMKAWHPEEEDVVRFLRIVTDPKCVPVLVHCQQGADRTGTMCAIYRIAVQGWSKEQALREMQDGGYGFHGAWQDLVQFVNDLDIDRIKQKAGIKDAVHHVSLKDPPQTHALSSPWNAKLFGMRGYPGIPPGMTESQFFPLIDEFGQYRHADWPGKIHCADDLAQQKAAEADELEHHPGPTDWDIYGGWQAGPQLAATGRFRTEKLNGKWWLVDPVGRLFWSHGIDSVHTGWSTTPITDRERWFTRLPAKDSPYGKFYGRGNWAPHNYYEGKSYETYDFSAANLQRKYGNDWGRQFHALLHRRLRSWGLNTIGNWSEPSICQVRKTPYVVTIHSSGRTLEGSQGYWGKFADVFDSGFAASIRADAARQRAASADDPWCLGCFVDNELGWGTELSLAEAALASPADQPAKRTFVADLRSKYSSIESLNAAWGTRHASWEALQASRTVPDARKAYDDLAAFATKTAEQYFRVCREEVKRSAPHTLYLGCRFAWVNDRAVRAAGKFCDLISFNRYQKTLDGLRLPNGVDLPVVIGEFHFGALDRGMFHTGLVATASQDDRADAYRSYVRSALRHPQIVGTHWFEFGDEPVTGRGDGENYQIGFVDVCDTPYVETIAASRDIGEAMYRYRAGVAAKK